MTMAQSNSMGAKSDLLFQLFRCHRLWMCALCPSCLPSVILSHHVVFLLTSLFFLSSSCLVFSLSYLFVFSCPFYLLLSSVFPFFLSWTLSLCSQLSLLSASQCLNQLSPTGCHYCLPLVLSLFFLPLQLSVFFQHSVPPSMCVPLCIFMILEVWDSWTSLNFKASDDGGDIKVKW